MIPSSSRQTSYGERQLQSPSTLFSFDPPAEGSDRSYRLPKQTHTYHLKNSSGTPWATMTVESGARKASHLPTFVEGDSITGLLEMIIPKDQHIKAVVVAAEGRLLSGPSFDTVLTFVEVSSEMWSSDSGAASGLSGPSGDKLIGSFSWPFRLDLPRDINLPGRSPSEHFRMPQTFLERSARISIQYNLKVRFYRSRFRVDYELDTMFAFIPMTRPPAPSHLRQLAYQRSRVPPGPLDDPSGWHRLDPVSIRGTLGNAITADILLTLYIAQPLSYARGTFIPLFLELSSDDRQALELVSSPSAVSVHLKRRIPQITPPHGPASAISSGQSERTVMSTALWWISSQGHTHSPTSRYLDGEIPLPTSLSPTTELGDFYIRYIVEALPFNTSRFVAASGASLVYQTVEITTLHAKGPMAKSYAPTRPGSSLSSSPGR